MLSTISKISDVLSGRERRNAVILFLMVLLSGALDALGVASIIPFLAVLSRPEIIHEQPYLSAVYRTLGFSSTEGFLHFLGLVVFLVVVFGLTFRAVTEYFMARFTNMRNYSISTKLLRSYLSRPYVWYLNRHSAVLAKTVLSEVQQVINLVLISVAEILAQSVIVLCLIVMLLLVDPMVSLVAVLLMGGLYASVYFLLRKYLSRLGTERIRANRERFQIAQEALGGIKELKAAGLEPGYLQSFSKAARRLAANQAANTIAGKMPRFVLEAIALGGMLSVIMILLSARHSNLDQILPTIGVFAFAGVRLLPAMQRVYQGAVKLRFGRPALDALHDDFVNMDSEIESYDIAGRSGPALSLKSKLELKDVSFTYPGADRPAIRDISISIEANTTVCFTGATGSGKTTLVDLIMGLLPLDSGEIQVDDTGIDEENVRSWQRSLGYVPQHIFLADDSVAANIAFGVESRKIDMKVVEKAARIAELHDFVVNEMKQGYDTKIGERGVRISGGQRQRIGIARALYHDPDVLIMDEATSALDNLTEKAVMDAVHNLGNKKTIILIAHRLTTVKKCDRIFLLEEGRVTDRGSYSDLLDGSETFRKMADAGKD